MKRNASLVKLNLITLIVFALIIACPSLSNASGFAVYTHGAKELGMLNSVVAHTEGPASNYFNPALITELPGTQIELGTTLLWPSTDFESDLTGQTEKTDDQVFYPSTVFVTHKLNDKLSLGFGVNSPFGIGTKWPRDWEGRYIITTADLETFNLNPNIAWRVTDRLTVAGGIDWLYADGLLKQNINLSPFGLSDARQKFDGDGWGWGYNLGIHYQATSDLSFGLSYRSPIHAELEGDTEFKMPQGTPEPISANFPKSGVDLDLDLPGQILAGVSYKPTDSLIFELGLIWVGWSEYEELKFKFDKTIAGSKTSVMAKDWKNTIGFNCGVKYNIDPTLAVSAGYIREGDPIPGTTFDPSVPTSVLDDFSLGVQKVFDKFTIAAAYVLERYHDRDKDNNIGAESGLTANGNYDTTVHILGFSVTMAL